MTFVNPRNPVAFKKIFGSAENTSLLVSLINAVLDLHDENAIQTVQVLNPYQTPTIDEVQTASFDIQARDPQGTVFIIDMLAEPVPAVLQRFVYAAAKVYASQRYAPLHPVILIGILDFPAFDEDAYLTHHSFHSMQTNTQDFNGMQFHVLELPKYAGPEADGAMLDQWVSFIKHASTLDSIPASADSAALHAAYAAATRSRWSHADLERYEAWLKQERNTP
jgi:predicted transposase/invertase (TIGR01784 family)